MAEVIYSKMSGQNDALYGKYEHSIKALITNESNVYEKKKSIVNTLYNVEKSNRFAETIMGQSDFNTFMSASEGQRAENDSISLTYKKKIEHIAFMKEFTITKEMVDDSLAYLSSDIKSRAKNFYRAYNRTIQKVASWALANGTNTNGIFNKATVDLTAPDGLALFSNAHTYSTESMNGQTQSNYFYTNMQTSDALDAAKVSATLNKISNKIRNFKDENGESMDYVADTIIIPCNRPELEEIVKKICGSERAVGVATNDINIQYGNWNIVVLPSWETSDDRFMVMSSEANKSLMGNMFFNRIPLDVQNEVDIHTRNYIWNGYCRFGVGFGSWKHIALCVDASSAVTDATSL